MNATKKKSRARYTIPRNALQIASRFRTVGQAARSGAAAGFGLSAVHMVPPRFSAPVRTPPRLP